VFFNPAASSVLPSIVDEDELVTANSGLWSAAVISQIALGPLAGALVAAVGVAPVAVRLLRLLALVQLLAALSAGATRARRVVLAGRPVRHRWRRGAWSATAARLVSNPRRPAWVFGPLVLHGLVDLVLASTWSLAIAMGGWRSTGWGPRPGW
jgi:hypothetical protein